MNLVNIRTVLRIKLERLLRDRAERLWAFSNPFSESRDWKVETGEYALCIPPMDVRVLWLSVESGDALSKDIRKI